MGGFVTTGEQLAQLRTAQFGVMDPWWNRATLLVKVLAGGDLLTWLWVKTGQNQDTLVDLTGRSSCMVLGLLPTLLPRVLAVRDGFEPRSVEALPQ